MAKKHNVSYNTLTKKANDEHWTEQRKEAYEKAAKKTQDLVAKKTANAAASNAAKLEKARGLLIDKILSTLEQVPKNSGTHIRQSQMDRESGRQISIDYDLQTLVNALEKLSTGTTADLERQKQYSKENNTVMMTYADLFSRPARSRTIEEIESAMDKVMQESGDADV